MHLPRLHLLTLCPAAHQPCLSNQVGGLQAALLRVAPLCDGTAPIYVYLRIAANRQLAAWQGAVPGMDPADHPVAIEVRWAEGRSA